MSHFELVSKINLDNAPVGQRFEESDFARVTPLGNFVQMKYHETEETKKYEIKSGIFVIQKSMEGYFLDVTSFSSDSVLDSFIHTEDINKRIDCFFNKIDVYKSLGYDVPQRKMLLYGPAGSGKSTSLSKVAKRYTEGNSSTCVIVWPTSKFEAYEVKDFIRTFDYKNVERMILIIEDIGGVEAQTDRAQPTDSSLLALLDNQEKTFKIPTFVIATTNFPEMFLGNLTNRPGRFDDKIEVGYPPAKFRVEFIKFFSKEPLLDKSLEDIILSKKCEEFTPAHLKEVVIRSAIYDKTKLEVVNEMIEEIERYKKAFSKQKSMGFS